jgi:guanylate kinase
MPRSPQSSRSTRREKQIRSKSGRLVLLIGPSCAGKTPLYKALGKFYPELRSRLQKLIMINSRAPRPGEIDGVDYRFRARAYLESLRADSGYAVLPVHNDLQALEIRQLESLLERGDAFYEGNSSVGRTLLSHPSLRNIEKLSVFISPLSKEEIQYFKPPERNVNLPDLLTDIQRRKLLRRTTRQKAILSLKDLKDIEKRASDAYPELQDAWRFDCVIPNHDGEDSDSWEAFYYPIGDARQALQTFAALLKGEPMPSNVEKWDEILLQTS